MAGTVSAHLDGARLWRDLMELARFGATDLGGVNRLALSAEEIGARQALIGWAREFGAEAAVDAAANLYLRLEGREPSLPPLMTGSHIDTQPTGGKFDGAYGVVAGLAALRAIAASGRRPRRSVEVVAWMNEEGSRFAPGMMGSAVFTGQRTLDDIMAVRDKAGVSVREAIGPVLEKEKALPTRPVGYPVAGYVEAHIEQGPVLEAKKKTIGVVTSIGGKRTFRVEVQGEPAHAGTSTRRERRDALVSAVAIVDALQKAIWDEADAVRFTIGMFTVTPNAPSVVPARVVFSVDLRHDDDETVRRLGDLVPGVCESTRGKCDVKVFPLMYEPPLQFPAAMRARVADASSRLGYPSMELPSPAGHDSRYMHYFCPTGMVFIPCKDGISHNEAESITAADAEAGARVLADVLFDLADEA
ncbi:MAG: Zn-dependent hydrolase [Betaproteobacteria bacterium]|nr:Zn-dependent hydrolase [Betaproteobacteria bacterium]